MKRCRRCEAPIDFVNDERTGRRIPVDPDPDPEGTIVRTGVRTWDGTPIATVYRSAASAALAGFDTPRYRPHADTCAKPKGRRPTPRPDFDPSLYRSWSND